MKDMLTRVPSGLPPVGDENDAPKGGDRMPSFPFGHQTDDTLQRIAYLQNQMKVNARRDVRLWILAIILITILATILVWVLVPVPVSKLVDLSHPYQLTPCIILLVAALFSAYATTERGKIAAARTNLIEELINSERKQAFSLLDPVTQLLSCRTIDNIAEREIARANRFGSALTFVAINLDNISALQKRAGAEVSDRALFCGARILRNTFRGSDAIFRLGPTQFLVLMPDTTEQQAEAALARLKSTTEALNADDESGLGLSFSYGVSPHVVGRDSATATEQVRRCMFLLSQKVNML